MKEDLLKEAQASFYSWRTSGIKRKHASPELKQQAVSLQAHYPVDVICSGLGISSKTLKNWSKAVYCPSSPNKTTSFVSLPISDEKHSPVLNERSGCAVLKLSNGTSFEIIGPSFEELSQLVVMLLREVN